MCLPAESLAISDPLGIVADIYAASSTDNNSDTFFHNVHNHFSHILTGHAAAIPRLQDVHQRGKLVRFRCMIQDTGLASQVYALDVGGSSDGRGCCAYSEATTSGSPVIGYEVTDYSKLRERQVIYAVDVPGETAWYTASLQSLSDTSDLANQLSTRLNLHPAAPNYAQPPSLRAKHPLLDTSSTGAILKLYPSPNEVETHLKSTEIAEFIGVLDYSYLPSAIAEDESEGSLEGPVKTLHVIYRLDEEEKNKKQVGENDWLEARNGLIEYIAEALEGDRLAAEFVLLSLYGTIHARRGALALGQLPLNLNLPSSSSSSSACSSSLSTTLASLLPRLVNLDFSIEALNKSTYVPESKDENLLSGVLQLPAQTTVVVDETGLAEGTLKDRGVRNVQALTQVVNDQTLAYVFPFSSFTFETDLRVIVLSKGKSLLPIECVVPVQQQRSNHNEEGKQASQAQLETWRTMLAYQPGTDFIIPDEMSEYIQNDFVNARQSKSVTQEDLVLRMTLARLYAVSMGRNILDEEAWRRTRELDELRKSRL